MGMATRLRPEILPACSSTHSASSYTGIARQQGGHQSRCGGATAARGSHPGTGSRNPSRPSQRTCQAATRLINADAAVTQEPTASQSSPPHATHVCKAQQISVRDKRLWSLPTLRGHCTLQTGKSPKACLRTQRSPLDVFADTRSCLRAALAERYHLVIGWQD